MRIVSERDWRIGDVADLEGYRGTERVEVVLTTRRGVCIVQHPSGVKTTVPMSRLRVRTCGIELVSVDDGPRVPRGRPVEVLDFTGGVFSIGEVDEIEHGPQLRLAW